MSREVRPMKVAGSYARRTDVRIGSARLPASQSRSQESTGLDDQQFEHRVRGKIERLTGRRVELQIDHEVTNKLDVDLDREVPLVILGANIFHYSGFARLCIEYAAASIQRERLIDVLEFHLLLARN